MKPTTLCFPINKKGEILLGLKKRGFGAYKYNGFGGKLDEGEGFRQTAVRELEEEAALVAKQEALDAVAFLDFRFPYEPELTHVGWVYLVRDYEGCPLETEEMKPQWFSSDKIPYEAMWAGDRTWLPLLWEGKKIKGYVTFGQDNESVEDMYIEEVSELDEAMHELIL